MMERIKELTSGWFGRLDDIVNDLKDAGYDVEDCNNEWISCWGEDDTLYTLYLAGTETTIYVDRITVDHV